MFEMQVYVFLKGTNKLHTGRVICSIFTEIF